MEVATILSLEEERGGHPTSLKEEGAEEAKEEEGEEEEWRWPSLPLEEEGMWPPPFFFFLLKGWGGMATSLPLLKRERERESE